MALRPTPAPGPDPLIGTALKAFRSGDWSGARSALQTVTLSGCKDPALLAMLATACRELGDTAAAHSAADAAIGLDGRHLRALLVKGELLADQGAAGDAAAVFATAAEVAARLDALPPDVTRSLARAQALRHSLQAEMSQALNARLSDDGYRPGRSRSRFTHALDLALGRHQTYVSEPRLFYYPELPSIAFFPREAFPWLDEVEAATDAMAQELHAVLADDTAFEPYLQTRPDRPHLTQNSLIDNLDWSSCYLQRDGVPTENAARCPATLAALANAPLCKVVGRSPHIMFSQLRAGAHIPPHNGFLNTRLICHLPLVAPPGCDFRVGSDVRQWEKGKAWVFDDTIEHEARSNAGTTRIILLFDVWRPELDEEERRLITSLLETIAAYSPGPSSWQ